MKPVLLEHFRNVVQPSLKQQFGYKNILQVPKVTKITLNVGYGRQAVAKDNSAIEAIEKTLSQVTGQKPTQRKSKKSISNFKIREGMAIGSAVTLRGNKMYEFLYKFINLSLPRVRDFRGISPKIFDKQGNCTIGIKEHVAFVEASSDSVDKIHGLQVVISTTAKNPEEGYALLKQMGFPFKDK
jgi:large subunit ribosomal protein L5